MAENHKHYSFRPDFSTLQKIQEICEEIDRYENPDAFIRESLDTFITWWQEPQKTQAIMLDMWKDITPKMKGYMKINAPEYYKNMEAMATGQAPPMKTQTVASGTGTAQAMEVILQGPKGIDSLQKEYSMNEIESFLSSLEETREKIQVIKFSKKQDALPYDGYPLIWTFYSRFLPIKITLTALAYLIFEKNKELVSFSDFSNTAYNIALFFAKKLRTYETANKVPRNRRLSTGLPLVSTEDNTWQDAETILKIQSSKERFIEHYVGMSEKSWKRRFEKDHSKNFFDGALNAMGLISVIDDEDDEFKVTLTSLGASFVTINNPVIDDNSFDTAVSGTEKKFILEKIIPRFELENKIVSEVLEKIEKAGKNKDPTKRKLTNEDLSLTFEKFLLGSKHPEIMKLRTLKESLSDPVTPVRVATMGRLAEIMAVKWNIDKHGKSLYEIP